jgi:hypothetical protein
MMEKEFPNLAPQATGTERFLGHPATRVGLGALEVPAAIVQLGANVGEKLADVTGVTGSLGKNQFVRATQVPEGTRGRVPGGIDAESINQGLAELDAMKRRGMAARSGRPVGEEWDVAGLAGALTPATLVYKGISKRLPKIISEQAPTLTGRTIGRMVSGGGTAAASIPDVSGGEDFIEHKGLQAGIGAAIPVGISTLGSIIKGGYKIAGQSISALRDTIRNFTERGQTKLAEASLRELAEESGEPALKKTIKALLEAEPIINKPTSAEAIASANIGKGERFGGPTVRLQSELANLPEATTKLRSIEAGQEKVRQEALKTIAKGQSEESVLLERSTASAKNYKKAFKDTVKADDELEALMTRPSMGKVLPRAKELATESGKKFSKGKFFPVESLHFMKMAMDDLIKNPERFGIGASEVNAITKTQSQFVKWIGKKSPAYDVARKEHKELSKVLNRVQVRDTLEKILTGPKGEERTAMFLNAVREIPRTFKKATGQKRFDKVEDILPPGEVKTVQKLVKELQTDAMATKMRREVNIPGATSPVTGKQAQLPSPLYRPTMIANWILKRGGEEGNKNVNRKAADILSDPSKAAEILGKMTPKWRQRVRKELEDFERFAKDPVNVAAIKVANE